MTETIYWAAIVDSRRRVVYVDPPEFWLPASNEWSTGIWDTFKTGLKDVRRDASVKL